MTEMKTDRRSFMKTSAIGAAALAMGGTSSLASAKEERSAGTQLPEYNPKFGVYDEWGPLKHCLVGTPDTFRFPENMDVGYDLFDDDAKAFFNKGLGQLMKDVHPDVGPEWQAEQDELARIIASHGIKVERPIPFTKGEVEMTPPGETGVIQVSPADSIWVVGNSYIELRMRTPSIRKNIYWQRRQFMDTVLANGGEMLHAPVPIPGAEPGPLNHDGYFEGGDIIQYGRDILCGVDPISTSETAYLWFKQAMHDRGYRVHKQTFNMIEIHLLAQMNIIGPELGLMCPEGFTGHEKCDFLTKGRGKDIKFIEITPEEVHGGGADVVMLDEKKVLVSDRQPRVAEELAKNGLEPIEVPLKWASQFASGIRCTMNIIHRDKSELTDLSA